MPAKTKPAAGPAKYRALVGLTYPTDEGVIARLLKGDQIPFDERGDMVTVAPGKLADGLPACSVPWLLEQGCIEAVSDE